MRLVGLLVLLLVPACSKLTSPPGPEPIASDTPVTMASAPTVPSGHPTNARPSLTALQPAPSGQQQQPPQGDLKIEDLAPGKGEPVKMGDTVSVHYTGTLLDGSKFDSSHDHPGNQPFTTRIPGQVIQGWNRGIVGMKVGGKRKLTIPPSLAYGAQARPGIPANSTLVFDIELLDIKAGGGAPTRQLPPRAP
jgi:FKBP-type peptidyl-prolyl cis-trans isomerase